MKEKEFKMKDRIQRRSELLVENRNLLHKDFRLENGLITVIAGAAFAQKDRTADPDRVKECRKLLRDRQGAFSQMRGNNELVISAKMAVSPNPEQYLDNLVEIYEKFQKGKFFSSSYRVLAASTICDAGKASQADAIVEKTNEILKGMNSKHPFLTSDDDTGFAVLLAMTEKSTESILEELEESYQILKRSFSFHDNAVYSLAQVLTTYDGDAVAKCKKAVEIFEAFKETGYKYGKEHELPSLGILINLSDNIGDIVGDVIEVFESFKGQKGFGVLDMSKQTKLMLGAMIVASAYGEDRSTANAAVANGALSIIIAQQAAMLAVIAATSASAAASSSH
jgi:hypothetical protein